MEKRKTTINDKMIQAGCLSVKVYSHGNYNPCSTNSLFQILGYRFPSKRNNSVHRRFITSPICCGFMKAANIPTEDKAIFQRFTLRPLHQGPHFKFAAPSTLKGNIAT
ncbi:hypothetical protein P5673_026903 [Acropora cervicornis]|uniref:Uncharacterized protein n=1 Tax=Acropora cervicornis TaxID=6130 RepID=A0AAD9Q001_ACRCE|nr:hypothetical protein P5673_026903 [Acropora cervicornis]